MSQALTGLLKQFAAAAATNPDAVRPLRKLLRDNLKELAEPALTITYEAGGPIGSVLAREIRRANDIHLVAELYNHLHNGFPQRNGMPLFPYGNPAFAEVAITVGEMALKVALQQPDLTRLRREGVPMFTNLAGWHSMLGQDGKARAVARRAVRFFAEGKESDDPARRAGYARALDMLATTLCGLGLEQQAATAGAEAVARYRSLPGPERTAHETDLARCLVNWAGGLRGRPGDTARLTAYEEAVALYRRHVSDDAQEHRPDLCQALIGFTSMLMEAAALDRAEEAAHEAVAVATDLALRRDRSFRQLQVMAEINHALVLQRRGRAADAVAGLEVAIAEARTLLRESPAAFTPMLVQSLTISANVMVDAGRLEDARAFLQQAIELTPPEPASDSERAQLAHRHFNRAILAYELLHDAEASAAAAHSRLLYQALGEAQHADSLRTLDELDGLIAARSPIQPQVSAGN